MFEKASLFLTPLKTGFCDFSVEVVQISGDVEVAEASFGLGLLSEAFPPQEVVQILKKWDWTAESIDVRCVAVHFRGKGLVLFHWPMRNVVDDVSGAPRRSAGDLIFGLKAQHRWFHYIIFLLQLVGVGERGVSWMAIAEGDCEDFLGRSVKAEKNFIMQKVACTVR
uniref:DUF4283 domain-containing protein n=1 Tax=Angiostrongylus cantonensis TaxID=6313 RepID=A0A0K0DHG3_ANGCA